LDFRTPAVGSLEPVIRLFDTMQRAKVDFVPSHEGRVSMYVCGPSPYDSPHLGHGRQAVVFDMIRRLLEFRGYEVTYVSNVTDVEDKIIERARQRNMTEPELVEIYEADYRTQMDKLNVRRPDETPYATQFIDQMLKLIAELVAAGRAYVVEGQGVYFQVDTLPSYGKLSHRSLDDQIEGAGARVAVDERKRDARDFALWKAAKPGEPQWESPWGPGRPGWHIECSAMSLDILGDGFDIHGGGTDLVFPHHENEIAQAEGAGHEFARYWLHNAMVNVNGEKMSKSLGNFQTLADVFEHCEPRAFRLFMLQTHYRKQMEVGEKELDDAVKAAERLDAVLRRARGAGLDVVDAHAIDLGAFTEAVDDDFDTPAAVAEMFEAVRDANIAFDEERPHDAARAVAAVRVMAGALGIELHDEDDSLGDDNAALVQQREEARARRDFAEADRLRDELLTRGIVVEDTASGTVWRRA
jgi:cysteinyl-tRNA synthetase